MTRPLTVGDLRWAENPLRRTIRGFEYRLPVVQQLDEGRAEPGHLSLRSLAMCDGRVEGLEVVEQPFVAKPVARAPLPLQAEAMGESVGLVLSVELGVNTSGYLPLSEVIRKLPPQLVLVAGGAS